MAARPHKHDFLWFDLETTGLDSGHGLPLEFAAVLCDDREPHHPEVHAWTSAIHWSAKRLSKCAIDDYARDVHARNGLWQAVEAGTLTTNDADEFLADLASQLTDGRKHAITLAGANVSFDYRWATAWFPRFSEYVSHRTFDVRTIQRAAELWTDTPILWPPKGDHRALADIRATIEECRVARVALAAAAAGRAK